MSNDIAARRAALLQRFPRAQLAHLPTPLEHMPNLSAELGGADVYIKRDDCTGLALGGNKARQLEFYLGEAKEQGADTILITGAVQSNYVRMAAAAARKCGMDCHLQLEERVKKDDDRYRNSGNVLIDRLLGATIHSYASGEDEEGADKNLEDIADDLRRDSRKPYVIHLSAGHAPLGALGYVDAAGEILQQLEDMKLDIQRIFVGSGSAHTHAGLLVGLRAHGSTIPVTGVCVRRDSVLQRQRVHDRAYEICALLTMEYILDDATDIVVDDQVLAPGYGQINPPTREAISLAAQKEGILVDPVYSAKTLAGLVDAVRAGQEGPVLFLHTGGQPAIFGYESVFTDAA